VCNAFRSAGKMLKMRLKYRAVFPNRGAIYDYSGVPQAGASFNISLKNTFSKCYRTLKQIAMGSPLGGANYNYLPQGVASQKKVGKHCTRGSISKNTIRAMHWQSGTN